MEKTVDALLEGLLKATQRLEEAVGVKESEPEEWLSLLDERESLIDQIRKHKLASESLSFSQKQQLEQIYEMNQRLIPKMDARKQAVQKQLNNIQRTKLAMNSYNEAGPNGYGAFFDRKN